MWSIVFAFHTVPLLRAVWICKCDAFYPLGGWYISYEISYQWNKRQFEASLERMYWMCIFAVNQHISICGSCFECAIYDALLVLILTCDSLQSAGAAAFPRQSTGTCLVFELCAHIWHP